MSARCPCGEMQSSDCAGECGRARVEVGVPVEVSPNEARLLEDLGERMWLAAKYRRKGWLLVYLRAHSQSHLLLRTIIQRSHARLS